MDQDEKELLAKFLKGAYSEEERMRISKLLEQPEGQTFLYEEMMAQADEFEKSPDIREKQKAEKLKQQVFERISHSENAGKQVRILSFRKLSRYAAILIGGVCFVGISWFFYQKNNKDAGYLVQEEQQDILPGSDRALLTLADGSTVSLSTAEKGQIAIQEGLQIEKTKNGEIVYTAAAATNKHPSVFNSVTTPNGGQYRVTLPDGSKALLNAGSSLTYPVHFSTGERRVKMTGEVYFEIAKVTDSKKNRIPFFVETEKQVIQVLGTTFNINAYKDEPYIQTTLVEGSVKVTLAGSVKSVLLQPGQQSIVGEDIQVSRADMKAQLAWVKGDFIFQGNQLGEVLRQLSRWYDIEVDCPARLSTLQLDAMISRSRSLLQVMTIIQTTYPDKIKLKLKGRRLIVTE